ncbi:MAG: hypothetical protein BAA00_17665 [Parageobacillus thermoglucosidasius]|nr:helix-turn-helix domain-containing protein [Parageobacillus thermoglucosidasius]OUM86710.1 MAG: hypothetical protein BAA00_17665 [Parageobacillus thermoglucosidasius]
MSKKELKRYKVIRQWIEGSITGKQAAELLSLSLRQVYRLKKRVLEEDENGVIHKNRGRKPFVPLEPGQSPDLILCFRINGSSNPEKPSPAEEKRTSSTSQIPP